MIGDEDAPDAHEGDMISFQYLRQSRSGLCLKRNDDRLLVEMDGRRRAWIDLFDVESIDATAEQLLETKRANEAAAKRLALTASAAAVHAAATAALETKQQHAATAASPTSSHSEASSPTAHSAYRPHWLDDDDNPYSNEHDDGDDVKDDDNESIAVVTGLYEELATGCGWAKVSTAEDMAIAFASQVAQRRSRGSNSSSKDHNSFEATAAASLEAMAEWFCATPRALQAAQACGLVALLKALRKHHPNLQLQRAAGHLFDQWQAQHKAERSAHRAARARTISGGDGGGGGGGGAPAVSTIDEGKHQMDSATSANRAERPSKVEADSSPTTRVNRGLFQDDGTHDDDDVGGIGNDGRKRQEEEVESEERVARRREASEMEEALARRAADNAGALAAKQQMAAAASARAAEAMAMVRAMARRRARSTSSSSFGVNDESDGNGGGGGGEGGGESGGGETKEAPEGQNGATAQADAAAGGRSRSASNSTFEAGPLSSSSPSFDPAQGRHKHLHHPRGAVALPGIGGNLTPFPMHATTTTTDAAAAKISPIERDLEPSRANHNSPNLYASHAIDNHGHGASVKDDAEEDNHKLIRELHNDLATAVDWHGGSDLGPGMGAAGAAGAQKGGEVAQVKRATAALKQLWELGAREEWLALVEDCGLNRLLKAVKRFHHDNRVRAQAQAVFEEWSIVARQATSASADADASVAAANEPAPSPSLASSSSSAAAAATPTRRGSGHSSYKQGAVSVSAAAEAPQSPPLVQRSTGGVETGGATPLFVQLQQYEDDLMKSVGWNGHSLDAALVTSQEEQNGSSALARTQKALKGLWRLDVTSSLLAFTDGQRCLVLLRALERNHPVEKVRLQAAALCEKWDGILRSSSNQEGPPSSPSMPSPPSPNSSGWSSINSGDADAAAASAAGGAMAAVPFVQPEVVAARAAGSSGPHAQYLCPLTQELMVDPVLAEDELTYERSAIEAWLTNHRTSPADPLRALRSDCLIANRAVRDAIEKLVLSTPDSGGLDIKLVRRWKWRKQPPTDQAKLLLAKGRVVEAALLGLPAAMGQLASLYFYGQGGLEQDPLKAFAWAQKAASSGDGPGMFRLAYCYHVGMGTPNGSNFASALRWYEAALQQGEATACHSIATLYFTGGPGLGRDQERAVSWYCKAADDHHSCHAQCALGWRYARGEGVEKVDLLQAAKWFELAALQGHCEAMSALGCLLLSAPDLLHLGAIALPPAQQQEQQNQPLSSAAEKGVDSTTAATLPSAKVDASVSRTSCGLAWLEHGASLGDESSGMALQHARSALASLSLLDKMARGPHREYIPDNR